MYFPCHVIIRSKVHFQHLRSTTFKRVGGIDVNITMILVRLKEKSLYWREQLHTRAELCLLPMQ